MSDSEQFVDRRPRCWYCNYPLSKKPRNNGYYFTEFKSPSGTVRVHKCCVEAAKAAAANPHLWNDVKEVRSDTYAR